MNHESYFVFFWSKTSLFSNINAVVLWHVIQFCNSVLFNDWVFVCVFYCPSELSQMDFSGSLCMYVHPEVLFSYESIQSWLSNISSATRAPCSIWHVILQLVGAPWVGTLGTAECEVRVVCRQLGWEWGRQCTLINTPMDYMRRS